MCCRGVGGLELNRSQRERRHLVARGDGGLPAPPAPAQHEEVRPASLPAHPVTCSYDNTLPAVPTASPEAGPGRPCSLPPSRPPDAVTMATGLYHSTQARGWLSSPQPCRQGTAGHRGQRKPRRVGLEQKKGQGSGCWRGHGPAGQWSREGGDRAEMVAPSFLPVPQRLPGSHHGGLRSSSGRPRPPLPASLASPRRCRRPSPRVPAAQSLRSGASLPGERPGEAPGSCSGSLSLPRPELRRRERVGKLRPGGAAGHGAVRRRRPEDTHVSAAPCPSAEPVPVLGGGEQRHHFRAVCGTWKRGGKRCPRPSHSSPLTGRLPGLSRIALPLCCRVRGGREVGALRCAPGLRGRRGCRPDRCCWHVSTGRCVYKRAVAWGKKLSVVAKKGQQTNDKSELLLQAYLVFCVCFVFSSCGRPS